MSTESLSKSRQQVIKHLAEKRFPDALGACKALCRKFPRDAVSWSLLGSIEEKLADPKAAITAYRKAVNIRPDYFEALYNLGCILLTSGQDEESLDCFRQALKARPDSALAHNNLGVLLRKQGKSQEAITHFRQAIQSKPDFPMAFYNLGNALLDMAQPDEAVSCYQRSLSLNPHNPPAYFNLGNAYRQLFLRTDAAKCYQEATRQDPGNLETRFALADMLIMLGKHIEAVEQYNHVLNNDPDNMDAITGKANALEKSGNVTLAYEIILPHLESSTHNPGMALTYANLCHEHDDCSSAIEWIDELLSEDNLSTGEVAALHQARGKILDRLGKYNDAFRDFSKANRLKLSLGGKSRHNEDIDVSYRFFSEKVLTNLPGSSIKTDLPVFIVGMPRSGTSLVEQIIASHPNASAGGELPYISRIVQGLPAMLGTSKKYPHCLEKMTATLADKLAGLYIDQLRKIDPAATRITDKLPHNFMWLGLMEMLFPDATIIHCIRNPMDNCLSLFTTRGINAHHSYAFDLEDLGRHYRKYESLMQKWKDILRLPILDVHYENLVSDFENEAERLVKFTGLDWHDNCLRYYEAGRPSTTLSYDQVRKPIYKGSVGRWHNYREFLVPLENSLK